MATPAKILNVDPAYAIAGGEIVIDCEGFDTSDVVGYTEKLKPQARRILEDQESHTHYNLHGSVFWRVKALN